MDKINYILCGMMFGDEGKGSFVDYLAHAENIEHFIRYNGGSHAGHNVITPDGISHKFSQLGSGMFLENSKTYLTENMVINIENIVEEAKVFSKKTGLNINDIISRIYIHENCYVVTPYHKLINKLRELTRGKDRQGTVGTGVSEVMNLIRTEGLGIKIQQFYMPEILENKLTKMQQYMLDFLKSNEPIIFENIKNDTSGQTEKEIEYLTHKDSVAIDCEYYNDLINQYKFNICKSFVHYFNKLDSTIFEGSQGVLLDANCGIKPNTTKLDTTNKFAVDMLSSLEKENIVRVGILKAFSSRHGMGIFPTEDDVLNKKIEDENQKNIFWNGKIRFGWFDGVLARYAQRINPVEQIFLSSIDKLDDFLELKVCNTYQYLGEVTSEFKEIFEYEAIDNKIIIKNIIQNSENLKLYLTNCSPIYIAIPGWNIDTRNKKNKSELPGECIAYIKELEKIIGIKITLISVGPTREHKIRID